MSLRTFFSLRSGSSRQARRRSHGRTKIDRYSGAVMSTNHVELDPGVLLWVDPTVVSAGQRVHVVCCGDQEIAVWSDEPDSVLLLDVVRSDESDTTYVAADTSRPVG